MADWSGSLYDLFSDGGNGMSSQFSRAGLMPEELSGWGNVGQSLEQGNQVAGPGAADLSFLDRMYGAGATGQMTDLGGNIGNYQIQNNGQTLANKDVMGEADSPWQGVLDKVVPATVGSIFTGGLAANGWLGASAVPGQSSVFQKALQGATQGAISTGLQGGNPLQGAVAGGVGGGAAGANFASDLGISNPALGKYINNIIGSTAAAGAGGGNPGLAALNTAVMQGVPLGAQSLYDSATSPAQSFPVSSSAPPTSGFRQGIDALLGQSQIPGSSGVDTGGAVQNSINDFLGSTALSGVSPAGGDVREQPTSLAGPNGDTGSGLTNLFSSIQSSLPQNLDIKPLAQGLLSYYNYRRNNKAMRDMNSQMQGMYGQNSPYAQQLRQQLDRRDAAGGRRSQYGAREVELQGNLAGNMAKLMPAIQQNQQGQMQNRNRFLTSLFQLAAPHMGTVNLRGQNSFGPQLDQFFGGIGGSGD